VNYVESYVVEYVVNYVVSYVVSYAVSYVLNCVVHFRFITMFKHFAILHSTTRHTVYYDTF